MELMIHADAELEQGDPDSLWLKPGDPLCLRPLQVSKGQVPETLGYDEVQAWCGEQDGWRTVDLYRNPDPEWYLRNPGEEDVGIAEFDYWLPVLSPPKEVP